MANTVTGEVYTGAYKNTSIVSRGGRFTISAFDSGTIPLIPVYKGEACIGFTVKLVQKPDKATTAAIIGPDNDDNGMVVDMTTGLGSAGTVGTQWFGTGALMALTAVEDADNTIDLTATVTSGPATTDLIIDVQALFLSNSLA